MEGKKKYLSLGEAESLLPEIRKSLLRMIEINNALKLSREVLVRYDDQFEDFHREIATNEKYFELNNILFKELHKMFHMGCIVKDLSIGLVDFYSKYKGREILLCWKFGEERINYWHDIDKGFSSRMHISMLNEI